MLIFLWFDDVKKENPEMIWFHLFGLTPSPAILTETIQHHVTQYLLTEAKLLRSWQVDFA